MANGIEHLNAVMELLPKVRLSIADDQGASHAFWLCDGQFAVHNAISIGFDMHLCLSTDERDLCFFSVSTPHVMGAFAGDTINIDDDAAGVIAEHVHQMIESGALLA